jgi:iron(III) transport system permease protein
VFNNVLPKLGLSLAIGIALVLALPILVIAAYLALPTDEIWQHLADTVLSDYLRNTVILVLGVGVGVLLFGLPTAWLSSMCEFPGRTWFEWALLLPLAMPAYIIAYTYTGMLDFSGVVQSSLRAWFGWQAQDYRFPEIRSLGGAISMLSLVLFPYVYLLARAAFLTQSASALEASRTLGASLGQTVWRVSLPLARPAIITGLSLALMETLADFGTVQYFGVNTFTTGIFRTWFGLGNQAAAAQLAAILLVAVFMLVLLERWSRWQARYHPSGHKQVASPRYSLRGYRAGLAVLLCSVPLLLGFILPVGQLLFWVLTSAQSSLNAEFIELIFNSLSLASLAAVIALALALGLAYSKRVYNSRYLQLSVRIAAMGYAIPGTVIAVGVLIPFTWLDTQFNHWDNALGLMLSGSLFTVLFAYQVRFLAVSLQTVEAGLGTITPSLDQAGRSLGLSSLGVLRHIHLPLLRSSLLTAVLLVFVDVLKELPATLILRPFNFNTLAVRAYELASDERLADAGLSALMIVCVGLIPVLLLSRAISQGRTGTMT